MMKKLLLTFLFCMVGLSGFAEKINLSCKCDSCDKYEIPLKLDLQQKVFTFGIGDIWEYEIRTITERFITTFQTKWRNQEREIGGEIFVLDRETGRYHRAIIDKHCKENYVKNNGKWECPNIFINSNTLEGECKNKLF